MSIYIASLVIHLMGSILEFFPSSLFLLGSSILDFTIFDMPSKISYRIYSHKICVMRTKFVRFPWNPKWGTKMQKCGTKMWKCRTKMLNCGTLEFHKM